MWRFWPIATLVFVVVHAALVMLGLIISTGCEDRREYVCSKVIEIGMCGTDSWDRTVCRVVLEDGRHTTTYVVMLGDDICRWVVVR